MAAIQQINRTKANYTGFPNESFPIDCEGMDKMQINNALLSVLGNIGGSKYILLGLTPETNRSGYVFLATADAPLGELLYVEPAAATTGTLCLKKTPVDVTAEGYPYNAAYEERSLFHGVGGAGVESFLLSEFRQLETNESLTKRLDALKAQVDNIQPTPIGMIMMWGSDTIMPDTTAAGQSSAWLPCSGQSLLRADYERLFEIIGTKFNAGAGENEFFLPDLRGRFPLMTGGKTNAPVGGTGGAETHTLTVQQMPGHTHNVEVYDLGNVAGNDTSYVGGGDDTDHHAARSTTSSGGGQAHNNMPPYLAINFIIKVK